MRFVLTMITEKNQKTNNHERLHEKKMLTIVGKLKKTKKTGWVNRWRITCEEEEEKHMPYIYESPKTNK